MIESPTILVIEDDPAVRTGIVDTLEYGGYRTLEAADCHEGMKMAQTAINQTITNTESES